MHAGGEAAGAKEGKAFQVGEWAKRMRGWTKKVPGLAFSKYHADGQDYIVLDLRGRADPPVPSPVQVALLCRREQGVGACGLLCLLDATEDGAAAGVDCRLRTFAGDGAELGWCGGALRCAAMLLCDRDGAEAPRAFRFETPGGVVTPRLHDDYAVTVDMGCPQFDPEVVPTLIESNFEFDDEAGEGWTGGRRAVLEHPLCVGGYDPNENKFQKYFSPQQRAVLEERRSKADPGDFWSTSCVRFGEQPFAVTTGHGNDYVFDSLDVDRLDLEKWGKAFEFHEDFPERTSAVFMSLWEWLEARSTGSFNSPRSPFNRQLESFEAGRTGKAPEAKLVSRYWERGRGEVACSAAAACVATVTAYLNDILPVPETVVLMPGGHLEVFWAEDNHVYVTGRADCIFEGTLYPPLELMAKEDAQAMLEEEERRQGQKQKVGAKEIEAELQAKIDRHMDAQITR